MRSIANPETLPPHRELALFASTLLSTGSLRGKLLQVVQRPEPLGLKLEAQDAARRSTTQLSFILGSWPVTFDAEQS